jgi:hypothetical protein
LLLLSLLMATGVVLADDLPETGRVPSGTEAQAVDGQAQTEDAQEPAKDALEATEAVQKTTEEQEAPAEYAQKETPEGPKTISGMSILGNREAPKSLVIVPWKSSEIGDSLAVSTMLDDSRQPVDRDVFLRALSYYEIRSERTP